MDAMDNEAAFFVAHAIVNSFSLQQDCADIRSFVASVLDAMPLAKEQRIDLSNLLQTHFLSFLHRKHDLLRIVVEDLLPPIEDAYQAFRVRVTHPSDSTYSSIPSPNPSPGINSSPTITSIHSSDSGHNIQELRVKEQMELFIHSFNNTYAADDWSEAKGIVFCSFVAKIAAQLANCQLVYLEECIEYYLMNRLYETQFPSPTPMDLRLSQQINSLQFITWDHLEIPTDTQERVAWSYAQEALLKIHLQKTPRDKVNCIFECFKIIAKGLTDVGHSSADDFLPCVIYVLLKANVPQLHSNLSYINTFRSPSEMGSQTGYFCVTLYAAAMFIENVTGEQLVIDQEFFRAQMSLSSPHIASDATLVDELIIPFEKDLEAYMAEASYIDTANSNATSCTTKNVTPSATPSVITNDLPSEISNEPSSTQISEPTSGIQSSAQSGIKETSNTGLCDTSETNIATTATSSSPLFKDYPDINSEPTVEIATLIPNLLGPGHPLHGIQLEPLLLSLLAIAVANKVYDARIRVALRRIARMLSVPHVAFMKLEEQFVRSLISVQNKPTMSTASKYRVAKVLLAATAGGAALALTGGLAAPIVGHVFGVMGLSAIATALTTTTGVSGVAFVGILCGATVTGGQMARKTAGLEEFELLRVYIKSISPSLPDPTPTHIKPRDLFVHFKQGLDGIIQKTKLLATKNDKMNQSEHTELIETSSTQKEGSSDDSGESKYQEDTRTNDVIEKGTTDEAKPNLEGDGMSVVAFTDHVHKQKDLSKKNSDNSSNNNNNSDSNTTPAFKALHTIIGVPGWCDPPDEPCSCQVWASALHAASVGFGDSFVLMWESQHLKKIGVDLRKLDVASSKPSNSIATQVAKKMIYHSLLSTTVLQEIAMVDSPWMLARDRAEKAGVLLAHSLMNGALGKRPTTLIGVSMGARVVFHCLEELSKLQDYKAQSSKAQKDSKQKSKDTEKDMQQLSAQCDPRSIVENVILIGAAVPSDMLRFSNIRRLVAGRLVNCYNPDDYTLSVIYRAVHWMQDGIYPPAGVQPIPSHPRDPRPIENINTAPFASSHIEYQHADVLTSILSTVGEII